MRSDISLDHIYLIEEYLFFSQYQFHKQKIMLHRASMRAYYDQLIAQGYAATYISAYELKKRGDWLAHIHHTNQDTIHIVDPTDTWLSQDIEKLDAHIIIHESPLFLTPLDTWHAWHDTQKGKQLRMHSFYIWQRKRLGILIDAEGKPAGGQWSFDHENRKPLPKKGISLPRTPWLNHQDIYRNEAKAYVAQYFDHHYGDTADLLYPITEAEALASLHMFLQERFSLFGTYEDALSHTHDTLFHSVMTPYLNIGLITPQTVLEHIMTYAHDHTIPLSSYEGLVRQIIGWREFMRGMYVSHGTHMRSQNFFTHRRPLPQAFWKGNTHLTPVDFTLTKIIRTGYAHHIERLMVLGNIFLLGEYAPHNVYRWFMEMFIDSYDWVMVPNVYDMSQFASGGVFATKPYMSGSNYIRKMGDYPRGPWEAVWDSLYWSFINKRAAFFKTQARMPFIIAQLSKKTPQEIAYYHATVRDFHRRLRDASAQ